MRILVVSDYFLPHWTGYAKGIYNLLTALVDTHEVTVLTVQHERTLSRKETLRRIHIIRAPYQLNISRAKYSFSLVGTFLRLVSHADLVLINSPLTNILPISLLTKLWGRKLYIFHQGDLILPKGVANKLIEIIFNAATYVSMGLAGKVATYTEDYARHSRMLKPFLHKFIPLLVPIFVLKKGKPVAALSQVKKRNKFLFGFAGRFSQEKGFDILFKSIPQVIRARPQAHFVFAGATKLPYEDFFGKNKVLYEKVEDHVTLLGLLEEEQLAYFYHSIAAIVIPSRSDCFNLVQAEAMIAGAPSIVADIPGARFLVKQSGFGYVFRSQDPADLAQKLIRIVSDNDIRKNYQHVVKLLDPRENAQKIREFIEG